MGQVISAGDVPEEIRIVNEFLNTIDLVRFGDRARLREEERDDFRFASGVKQWLIDRHFLERDASVTEEDRALAVQLRSLLRDFARANSARVPLRTIDSDCLGAFPLVVHLAPGELPRLVSGGDGVRGALATIVADVATAGARGTWGRLKICQADDCQWAYFDHSRSRTGRWCAMETCGNRHKTRAYRARRKRAGREQASTKVGSA